MNRKISLYFWIATMLFLLNSCVFKIVNGDGNIITEAISASDFDEIELSGTSMILNYKQSSETPSVQVSTDKNVYDMFSFTITDRTLKVKPKAEYRMVNISPTQFIITATSSKLEELETSGSMNVNVNSALTSDKLKISKRGSGTINLNDSVTVEKFSIETAGSGTLNAPLLFCKEFDASLAGSGELNLGGTGKTADFSIAGSGDIYALNFEVEEIDCDIAGSGNIEVFANKLIKADVAGSGSIRYKGNPQIKTNGAHIGSVKKVD